MNCWGVTPMKISVPKKKWAQASHKRSWEKLAGHVLKHYPMDKALHKAVRDSFKSMDACGSKLQKSAAKSTPRKARKTARRKSMARRRTTARRRTARKRSAPKRRRTARRRNMRRKAS